ncbi:hypothetical protein D9M72_546440 [compost metagenome]
MPQVSLALSAASNATAKPVPRPTTYIPSIEASCVINAASIGFATVASNACGSLVSAACNASSPLIAAVMAASAVAPAMQDFVAATLCSLPACKPNTISACSANGLSVTLTMATVMAPPALAAFCKATMSGLAPDCETVKCNPSCSCRRLL